MPRHTSWTGWKKSPLQCRRAAYFQAGKTRRHNHLMATVMRNALAERVLNAGSGIVVVLVIIWKAHIESIRRKAAMLTLPGPCLHGWRPEFSIRSLPGFIRLGPDPVGVDAENRARHRQLAGTGGEQRFRQAHSILAINHARHSGRLRASSDRLRQFRMEGQRQPESGRGFLWVMPGQKSPRRPRPCPPASECPDQGTANPDCQMADVNG